MITQPERTEMTTTRTTTTTRSTTLEGREAWQRGWVAADRRIERRSTDRGRSIMATDLIDIADSEVEMLAEQSGIRVDLDLLLERWAGFRARGLEELVRLAEEAEARERALIASYVTDGDLDAGAALTEGGR